MGLLRLLLALSVVNGHGGDLLGFRLLDQDMAVQAFYVISGFYMALVLHEKYLPENSTYFDFISNRFLRIFPGYFAVLVLTITLLFAIGWYHGRSVGPFLLWAQNWAQLDLSSRFYLVLSHLALFGQDSFLFLGIDGQGGLYFDPNFRANRNEFWNFMLVPQAWSLSLELYFYMLAPFLVRRSAAMLGLMIAASLALRFVLALTLGWKEDPWAYRFFPSELALFLCGSAVYRVYRAMREGKLDVQTWLAWGALGVAACAACWLNRYPGGLVIWLNIAFVVTALLAAPFLFKLTRQSRIDAYFGELSYPIYLCHVLVIWLFSIMDVPRGLGWSAGILSVTLLLSIMLYWGVDRRVDDFRHRKFPAPRA